MEELREFVAARYVHLRRTAYLLCGDWHRAEDLVQTALIKVYLRSRRIAPDDAERQPASVHPSRKVDEGAQTRPHAEPSASSLRSRVGHGLDGTRTSRVAQTVGDDPWPAVYGLYAAERGARPLIGVAVGVCQAVPQWRSSRRR